MADGSSDSLQYLTENLSSDAQLIITYMQDEFAKMKQDLKQEFTTMFSAKLKEVDELKEHVKTLSAKVLKLESLVDEADQYERRDCLILSGPAIPVVTSGENCKVIAQEAIKRVCRVEIETSDISTVHRLGKKPTSQQPDKRSLIVKFCRRDTKNDIYRSSRNQPRPSQLFVNESLSPSRRKIYSALREMKKKNPNLVNGCSTFDGKVYAYTKVHSTNTQPQRDRRHLISDFDGLKKFCHEYVKQPLDSFLSAWENTH